MAKELQTKDLVLKKGKISDAEMMHNNFFKEEESAKYMLWRPTKTIKDAEQKIEKWNQNRGILFYGYTKENDEPIGFVCIKQNRLKPSEFGEIGICVGSKFRRKGYARQMLKAILDYCKTLGATKIEYSYMKGNVASKKLAESFGFEYSYQKQKTKANGEPYTEVFYKQNV